MGRQRPRQGVFSWFLIKALRGEADRNKDGVVTTGEVHLYLLENVERYTTNKFREEQTPIVSPSFNPKFPLAVFGIEDWYERGSKAYDNKQYRLAINYYSKAIELNPNYSAAYNDRGNAKDALGDKQGAIADYQQAARLGDEGSQKWLKENGYSW